MFTSSNNNTILDRQTIRWGDLNFVRPSAEEEPPSIGTLLTSNILKLKITDLDLLGEYFWGVYTQETLLNISATNTGTFTLTGSDTEQEIDIPMVDNLYAPNNTYYFGMRKVGGEEKIQIRFTTGQNLVKATGSDIINSLPGGSVTYNGLEVNTTNNRFLTEGSLELGNITTFDNTKIPTNLAVQTFVNNAITNFNLDTNNDFTDLKTRVSDVETDKRDISDSYSRTQIDTKDSNTLTSANNYTDGQITTLSNSVNSSLADKEDVANKGVAGGYAGLDGAGLVPSSQLPSFVDDVLEFADFGSFPATGETGKIYVALDTNKTYRWSGSTYAELKDDTAIWGEVSGTLSNQTDLQNALNSKQDTITANSINLSEIETIQTNRILGRNTAGNGNIEVLRSNEAINTLNTANAFDNQVRTNRLDQLANPTSDLDLNNNKITNLADPTGGGDATNKGYVDVLDTETRESIPFYDLLTSYNSRATDLSQTPTEWQKSQLQQSLGNIKNTPAYYLNGDTAIFDGLTTNFIASGTANQNGTFDGSSPVFSELTNEINGIKGFRNISTGTGFNNTNVLENGFNNSFTLSAWVWHVTVSNQRIIGQRDDANARADLICLDNSFYGRALSSSVTFVGRFSDNVLSPSQWQKITVVYQKNTDTASDVVLYHNGVRVDSGNDISGTFTGVPPTSTTTFEIGSRLGGGQNRAPSTIAEVEIIPGFARSQDEEMRLFNLQRKKYNI